MTMSLVDRWARFRYLQSLELRLDWMPGRRRRAVLRELRDNLDAAAAERGMRSAIADLGRPAALAREYVAAEPVYRPRWTSGALAAGVAFGAWLYATLFYTVGMLDALASTGTAAPATGSFLGTRVQAAANADGLSAGFTGFPWAPLLVVLLTFLLVSRAWNVLPGRRDRTAALA